MATYIQQQRCTVQDRRGGFCDAESMDDVPFPICTRHGLELYRRIKQTVDRADPFATLRAMLCKS